MKKLLRVGRSPYSRVKKAKTHITNIAQARPRLPLRLFLVLTLVSLLGSIQRSSGHDGLHDKPVPERGSRWTNSPAHVPQSKPLRNLSTDSLGISAIRSRTLSLGEPVRIFESFSDPDESATHFATIDWGDGTSDTARTIPSLGRISGIHHYTGAGAFTAKVHVKSDRGREATADFTVTTVNEPPAPRVIALVDTGIDLTNSIFEGRLVDGFDFTDLDKVPDDEDGHGTSMGSLILRESPSAMLMPLKVVTRTRYAPQELISEAVSKALEMGAHVIYVGFGAVQGRKVLADSIDEAERLGVPVIAPSGSEPVNHTLYPAAFDSVISVVALDNTDQILAFHTVSGTETIAAPGYAVETAKLGGGSVLRSGSSIAAARIAGLATKILTLQPRLTPLQMRQVLKYSGQPLGIARWDGVFDLNRIDRKLAEGRSDPTFNDLSVRFLTVVPRNPMPGQPFKATVAVANSGNIPVSQSRIRMMLNGDEIERRPVGPLEVGSTVDLEFNIPSGVPLGSAALVAELEPAPFEAITTNNILSTTFTPSTQAMSDVSVTGRELRFSKEDGAEIELPYTIHNLGNQDEPDITVVVYLGLNSVETNRLSLAVGESRSFQKTLRISASNARVRGVQIEVQLLKRDKYEEDNVWTVNFASRLNDMEAKVQYADSPAPVDVVFDAPWRTIRNYIPVLAFVPDWPESRSMNLVSISISDFDPINERVILPLFFDHNDRETRLDKNTPSKNPMFQIIDPQGNPWGETTISSAGTPFTATDLRGGTLISNFWHYIVRIPPWGSLGEGGLFRKREAYLLCEMEYQDLSLGVNHVFRRAKVLRISLEREEFPVFDEGDHYYDGHVHTIAEQTVWGDHNEGSKADTPEKNFGGPLAMLLEASYTVGLTDRKLSAGNWHEFRNELVTTDHNAFYSQESHVIDPVLARTVSRPSAPTYGPTGGLKGAKDEFDWYRSNFGPLAGEEVDLSSKGFDQAISLGFHFLVYDSDHVEGPWHGGYVLGWSDTPNTNDMQTVLTIMRNSEQTGFGYAAHPWSSIYTWPTNYFDEAIGFFPWNYAEDLHVSRSGDAFLFKGSQVWNTRSPSSAYFDFDPVLIENPRRLIMNPFSGGSGAFRLDPDWDKHLREYLDNFYKQVKRAMPYYFAETPREKFIRKLFMVAGTDAHGDFNYGDDTYSTALERHIDTEFLSDGNVTDNAYARVRTYVLSQIGGGKLSSYEHGNSVLTDGPILRFNIDSDGRHNPGGKPRWHDDRGTWMWENKEGQIGGKGVFDAGLSVLIPYDTSKGASDVSAYTQSEWKKSVTPDASNITKAELVVIPSGPNPIFRLPFGIGEAGVKVAQELGIYRGRQNSPVLSAVVLEGMASPEDPLKIERAITNPIWEIPVGITITSERACPIRKKTLTVTFEFPISMKSCGDVYLEFLDNSGNSFGVPIKLEGIPGWQDSSVSKGTYTATNIEDIECPNFFWNAETHIPDPLGKIRSAVVYMTAPVEHHGSTLNDIGRTFVMPPPGVQVSWTQTYDGGSYVDPRFADTNTTELGFLCGTYQTLTIPGTIAEAKDLLVRRPEVNLAQTNALRADGFHAIQVVNFDTSGTAAGIFAGDQTVPGIPGRAGSGDGFVIEISGFVEFPSAGLYEMGITSDGGFSLDIGWNAADPLQQVLVSYPLDRPTGETLFKIPVTKAGIYPLRLIGFNSTGGANFEWYSLTSDGRRILINDQSDPAALKTYRRLNHVPPRVVAIFPAADAEGVPVDSPIEAVVMEQDTPIDPSSVGLLVNGFRVPVEIKKEGRVNTVTYRPTGDFALGAKHNATVLFAEVDRTSAARTWEFTVAKFAAGARFVEAEDYNFGGGSWITNANGGQTAVTYAGGAYAEKAGVPGTDYFAPENAAPTVYRVEDRGVAIQSSGEIVRNGFSLEQNFQLIVPQAGGWFNYTRDFPEAGVAYDVFLAGASESESGKATLELIVSDPSLPNQTVRALGEFVFAPRPESSGFGLLPLTLVGDSKTPVAITAQGTQTFRIGTATDDIALDYLVFMPRAEASPRVRLVSIGHELEIHFDNLLEYTPSLSEKFQPLNRVTSPYRVTPESGNGFYRARKSAP